MAKAELQDEFDNGELNHFSHYDYLLQVIHNGQGSAFKDHLSEMSNNALVTFLELIPHESKRFHDIVKDEIKKRMEK